MCKEKAKKKSKNTQKGGKSGKIEDRLRREIPQNLSKIKHNYE